jgi:hypothetical protein
MSAADRALLFNARGVEKLNQAVGRAQSRGEPDVAKIAEDFMGGGRVVTLGGGWNWTWIFGALFIAAAIGAATNKKFAVVYNILMLIFVVAPALMAFFSWMAETARSVTALPGTYSSPGPKCGVSGCGSSASYAFNPPGYFKEMKLCYEHKNSFENRLRYASLFDKQTAKAIVSAYKDLLKASKLDPSSTVILQNLEQARELAEIVLEHKV